MTNGGEHRVSSNLFVAGATKSGTSTLHDYLALHPDIFMSAHKEPHYFTHHWRTGRATYEEHFRAAGGVRYRGESSTGYGLFAGAAERIALDTDDPRVLFSLRNPVDRAWSHYWWLRGQGQERRPFSEAFAADRDEQPDPENPIRGTGNFRYYYANGCYGTMISRYLDVFGSDPVWIAEFSELVGKPETVLADCWRFLELAALDVLPVIHANDTKLLRFPMAVRVTEHLTTGTLLRRLHRRAPWVAGVKHRTLAALRRPVVDDEYPRLDAVTRDHLIEVYRSEVELLRRVWPAARGWWLADFPVE